MSRGKRATATGNLTLSMRDNYGEHGVEEYYRQVGATYRNPHYPGVRLCIFAWLNKWWTNEQFSLSADSIMLFDMACGKQITPGTFFKANNTTGSGEATAAFEEWCHSGRRLFKQNNQQTTDEGIIPRKKALMQPVPLDDGFPRPRIAAADPFTSVAYNERTTYPCSSLSFSDIAEGSLPQQIVDITTGTQVPLQPATEEEQDSAVVFEMVVCSFALHLIETPSEIFALLWELSLKSRWLVILAPHKRPEIKEGWGWAKWNVDEWAPSPMVESKGEILHERVHCRVYRSVNFQCV